MSVSKQDAEPIHGIQLETYAGIQAALAGGVQGSFGRLSE